MGRTGYADLPLHHGRVPRWLAERMTLLGGAIIEAIILDRGPAEVLKRLADPLWFQSLGCVLGMDWHSSGITTSVMGALKRAINPRSKELGIFICGGRGKQSLKTPSEILVVAEATGLNGEMLVRASKLSAKTDNTAVQDGFQLYLHNFILTSEGEWTVVQQGLNDKSGMARRYHWHSPTVTSFLSEPHSGVTGLNQGLILNLTHKEAQPVHDALLEFVKEEPQRIVTEIKKIEMPRRHEVCSRDVDLKRLGAVLTLARESDIQHFENMLLIEGLGPRTLQSLVLVSEIIYGTPSRFSDPARYSFAHGGKDGHPFPVPLKVYDESIQVLRDAVDHAKIGFSEKQNAVKLLSQLSLKLEKNFTPGNYFAKEISRERDESWKYGGMTVMGKAAQKKKGDQLSLF